MEMKSGNVIRGRPMRILGGAKKIWGRMCNEAVRGDMGIDTLRSRRHKAKLKWWYKVASMPEDRAF